MLIKTTLIQLFASTFIFFLSLLPSALFASDRTSELTSESFNYINQSGSTMSFEVAESGAITGYYVTALGCGIGIKRPLVGWRNGKAITFSVNFEECKSMTSWIGHSDDLSEISTIWTLAKGSESWDMKLTGVSNFKRVIKK